MQGASLDLSGIAPFSQLEFSLVGVIPKKTPGEFRLIYHLFPKGLSVNNGISSDSSCVSYASIANAISHFKAAEQGCF